MNLNEISNGISPMEGFLYTFRVVKWKNIQFFIEKKPRRRARLRGRLSDETLNKVLLECIELALRLMHQLIDISVMSPTRKRE